MLPFLMIADVTLAATPTLPPVVVVEEARFPRFRWGAGLEGGPYFFDSGEGGLGAITGRIGIQIVPRFALYLQGTAFVGGGVSIFADVSGAGAGVTASTQVLGGGASALLGELEIGRYFYAALGPEIVVAGVAGPMQTAGVFPGVAARGGVWLSEPSRKRDGFQLGVALQVVFTPEGVLTIPTLQIGYDAF